jgi:hypothetical protein
VTLTAWPVALMPDGTTGWRVAASDVPPAAAAVWLWSLYVLLLTTLLPVGRVGLVWALRGARGMAMLAVLWLPFETDVARRRPPAESLRVTLLAVGGGQCAVVEPPSGRVVLVDAAPTACRTSSPSASGPTCATAGVRTWTPSSSATPTTTTSARRRRWSAPTPSARC